MKVFSNFSQGILQDYNSLDMGRDFGQRPKNHQLADLETEIYNLGLENPRTAPCKQPIPCPWFEKFVLF